MNTLFVTSFHPHISRNILGTEVLENFKKTANLQVVILTPFYKKDYFDCILHTASLHHLETGEERIKSLQESYRVLKHSGLMLLTVWNNLQPRFLFSKKDIFIPWKIKSIQYHRFYHLFDYFELRRLIEKTDFKIIRSNIFGENLVFILKK
jgi:SAM-dependent methyltransferase